MWFLTEEEVVPSFADSSDDEKFQKAQKKKQLQRKKSAHETANRFAGLALLEND